LVAGLIGALDQGTTSTRFLVVDRGGQVVASSQRRHAQILPRPGWVEHDPLELWDATRSVIAAALESAHLVAGDFAAIGVTSQRETTIVWDRFTGQPLMNAIVWQDTRTERIVSRLRESPELTRCIARTGLRPASYFSAPKLAWIMENVARDDHALRAGQILFGNVDSWLIWNLTGGVDGGRHVTDVTNASRTMLMDLTRRRWDPELLEIFRVPEAMLPRICPSSSVEEFGTTVSDGPLRGVVPIMADLGDQQAAMVGQTCFARGSTKVTYGTGSFLLANTGPEQVASRHGLLTTACYELQADNPIYALEGSVGYSGGAFQWLVDHLRIASSLEECSQLAGEVCDSAGVYFVPAFSGLFAPYWRPNARGVVVGLSSQSSRAHLARAGLEAICYQSRDVLEAMRSDEVAAPRVVKVDGGVTANDLCMQIQADVLGVPVLRPACLETTALGAAFAAGLAAGLWSGTSELEGLWREGRIYEPTWSVDQRESGYAAWRKALERSLDWVAPDGARSAVAPGGEESAREGLVGDGETSENSW
jgi:glycerol kinase